MAYKKQNFADGNVLNAKQLNNMEAGIIANEKQIEVHNTSTGAHADIRELIDNLDAEVDKKVNTSDIANDLETSSINQPLSAKQGVVLKKYIENAETASKEYTDKQILNIPKPDVSGQIEVHNTSTGAHADIRELIDNLDTEVDKKVNTSDIDALYAELDKKVNTSDIINDLITSVSNKPLSAKQGTVLKKSIDTLTSEVENLDIPTKLSELENDGNYILTEDETKDVVETNYFDSESISTIIWDGDTSGLVTAGNYYKLSDDTPTADDLLFGGTYTFDNGNSMTFTSDNLDTSTANIILVNGGYAVIVLADSAVWDNTTFPEAGIYLINDGDFYIAEFRINRYSFTRKVLDLDYLPTHTHEWSELGERKLETGGNTVTSDGIVYDRYIKVSDIVPTSTELTGGTISYCPVTDGVKGELVTATFPEGIYTIVGTNPIQIACDGYVLAVIATKASSSYTGVTEAGTYFCQNSLFCVESLTINGYTGYPSAEIVPVSKEYLPAPSWNDLEDKPFGETTETTSFDILTWDGNTDGHYSQTYDTTTYCKISDNLPTNEELQQGGTLSISANGEEMSIPFAGDDLGITQEDGSDYTTIGENAIVNRSEITIEDITLTPGLYFVKYTEDSDETYTTSLTINDYEFTETTTTLKKLDSKFTHNADWNANDGEDGFILNRPFGEMIVQSDTFTWDGDTTGLERVDITQEGTTTPYYRVYNEVPTVEELQQGGTFSISVAGEEESIPFTSEELIVSDDYVAISGFDNVFFFILNDNATVNFDDDMLVVFAQKGIYVITPKAFGSLDYLLLQLNGYSIEQEVVKTIDSKYLPNTFKNTRFHVQQGNLYIDEDKTILATPADVKKAFDYGNIWVKDGVWEYPPTMVNFTAYPFMAIIKANGVEYQVGSAD